MTLRAGDRRQRTLAVVCVRPHPQAATSRRPSPSAPQGLLPAPPSSWSSGRARACSWDRARGLSETPSPPRAPSVSPAAPIPSGEVGSPGSRRLGLSPPGLLGPARPTPTRGPTWSRPAHPLSPHSATNISFHRRRGDRPRTRRVVLVAGRRGGLTPELLRCSPAGDSAWSDPRLRYEQPPPR